VKYISDRVAVMYMGEIMEIAESDELYENSLHPYTKTLLAAIPVPDPDVHKDVSVIKGEACNAGIGKGCAFAGRCTCAMDKCHREKPFMKTINGHSVACHMV
uniref:oligopeptide/dipeptide ABC transporter ATP-binding protein n=1 Tax=Anaerovibrio sp. TaxID=1872532 RepID=UPI0025E2950C